MAEDERIRSFVALELPESHRALLARAQEELRRASSGVRWADPAGIHLTLKFLGDVPAGQVAAIASALGRVAAGMAPFTLGLGEIGAFPPHGTLRVLWLGLNGELDRLRHLQKGVEGALVALGFPAEARPFEPHLTLGRVRPNSRPVSRPAGLLLFQEATPFTVAAITLMASRLTPVGARYRQLSLLSLSGPRSPG